MALKSLEINRTWVERMLRLAESPWERAAVEQRFVDHGWMRPGEVLDWFGGACAPHVVTGSDDGIGHRLELESADDSGRPDIVGVRLPCALFWPPTGRDEDEEDEDDEEDEEDELDGDYGSAWVRFPDARREAFEAEYVRLRALVVAELGEPDEEGPDEQSDRTALWRRPDFVVELIVMDDLNTYSYYDVILLRVARAR
ncbi:hypothetical protein [Embleya hyalina]|uniref:Uncharacterized protein n=1 Tax=Embleya hyalina TaxID=516124 RepID=A0A401Z531_9ACTN|nr:hypothetical protein [Embleya hyalina]GCE01961.1 hypothetical protein EHYA_09736 [Embleya hyalina]